MGPDIDAFEALPELPPADFDFLIYSLRLQAELSLGLLPFVPPGQGETEDDETGLDLDLARHNIDLLAMLQQKTKGNLTTRRAAGTGQFRRSTCVPTLLKSKRKPCTRRKWT